ncbi:HEXXH motif domain-containing protein [Streptomyces sp. NBC_00059]|uniref:HEXXH motif domain-containing protein n=1 Tax=Streptomyces sp. NBC_00059 TaxID=2975635 RepID=UPI002252954D|nr:HEXXH motif domain-containing protein [Streptomyces sp. NBC_00059]MCX5415337.1 HEXXH motif domain-containing protein [Streptomyces sp. NBC_00059]
MYEPIRMPGPLFDEIAAGGGSPEAVAFLVRGERTRRLLLLRELLDFLDTDPGILGALEARAIWPVLEGAAVRAPEAVDALLLTPQVGSWLAHTLRRLHGTASGPPLWADAGQIAAVAVAAALHAGTDAELLLPARGTALSLPALGMVRLPGRDDGDFRAVPVSVSRGALTVRAAHGPDIVLRPLTDPESAHWLPVHRLDTGPGARAVQLDDLDPYRDLDEPTAPGRLDPGELQCWHALFRDAVAILRRGGSGPGGLRPEEIGRIVPWHARDGAAGLPVPAEGLSASTGDAFASMVIARPPDGLALAETLVHEFQHSKLGALLHLFPLLDDDRSELHYAPWRADPRHLPGLLHGAYAFAGVAGFWRQRIGDTEADPGGRAPFLFAMRRLQTRMVLRTLATRARLTGPGLRLVTRLSGTVDAWLREPVEPATVDRARAAAVSHRVEWRLRNLRCGEDDRGTLVKALLSGAAPVRGGEAEVVPGPGRGYWQDDRTRLFRKPLPEFTADRTPTADELLVAGEPAAARTAYAAQLRGPGPLDPHALSGWLLAHTALHPSDRRLLARPERFAALAQACPPERWTRTARWLAGGPAGS